MGPKLGWKGWIEFLFPRTLDCMLCGRRYGEQPFKRLLADQLCPKCFGQFSFIEAPVCSICGRPTSEGIERCDDCSRRRFTFFVCNRSAVRYNEVMRKLITTYKYHRREHLVDGLVQLVHMVYQQHFQSIPIDAITYIPLYEDRLFERRFNQAEQLAVGLSQLTGIPVCTALFRIRDTHKQSHRSRTERLRSLQGAFTYNTEVMAENTILLIDDIYTTGSTINEAARILVQNGWKSVYSCTVARA